MRLRLATLADHVAESLWFIPALSLGAALLAARALSYIDHRRDQDSVSVFAFDGGPDSARSFLSTIASATLSMTVLVFTVTMLVLQVASSQLSPRVLPTFLGDRRTQTVLGLFVATFTYALLALREVRDDFVPALTVWFAFALTVTSIGAFVYYINHVAQSIRPVSVMDRVAQSTREAIDRVYPQALATAGSSASDELLPVAPADRVYRWSGRPGVITGIDEGALADAADRHECVVGLEVMVGDFLSEGTAIASAWGPVQSMQDATIVHSISVGPERTTRQNPGFGFRELVDIAQRALSPGVNDPTTALQALERIHDLLLMLSTRSIPSPRAYINRGRSYIPTPTWEDYVSLALDEIRESGGGSIQILRRIRYLLHDLEEQVPAERRPALREQLLLLDEQVAEHFSGFERERAAASDPQGQGTSGRGGVT